MRLIIAQLGKNETVAFAAKELVRLIKAMDKTIMLDFRIYSEKTEVKNALWVGLDEAVPKSETDRIYIKVTNGVGVISGSNERSVLFAAYRFMKELGCRFLYPGAEGEYLPQRQLDYADLTLSLDHTESHKYRGICIEGAVGYEHVMNTIDWLPKMGLNVYYSQFFSPTTFFKRYYKKSYENEADRDFGNDLTDADVDAMMVSLTAEVTKRGLSYHDVGHGWSSAPFGFVASGWEQYHGEISDEMRSSLALFKGKRGFWNDMPISTQLCYSQPAVRERVTDFAVEYCKNHPNVNCLHFSMGDGGRNHCECEECIKVRPSDHSVTMLNLLDEKLTRAGLDTKVGFGAYADTLYAPIKNRIKNPDRFCLEWAPIARSFTQTYDELDIHNLPETAPFVHNQDMPRNTVELNYAFLAGWMEQFSGDVYVFDYQLMWDHLVDPGYYDVAKAIHRDVCAFESIGLMGMISCQSLRCAFPNGLPQYVLAETLWDKGRSFEEIKDEYYAATYGEYAKVVEKYLSTLSELVCPPFVRGEKKLAAEEVISRFTALKQTVVEFKAEYIDKLKDTSVAWQYLYLHTFFTTTFADLYIARYKEDEEAVAQRCGEFKALIAEHQTFLDTVFDEHNVDFVVLSRYLKRHPIK